MSTGRRDSDSKRHSSSSKYDRYPSPKRYRRDDSEKGRGNDDGDSLRRRDYDQKRLPPLEVSSRKVEDAVLSKGLDKRTDQLDDSDKTKLSEKKENGSYHEKKHSSDLVEIPRSRSHIQHDDRGNTRRSDRSFDQKPSSDRAWGKDSRDQHGYRESSRYKSHSRDDRGAGRGNKDGSWRHDGFFELEANPSQPASRKRPAFSEQKIAVEDVKKELPNKIERNERGSHIHIPRHMERDRGDRGIRRPYNSNSGDHRGFGPSTRDRFSGSTVNDRVRDGTYVRQAHQATSVSDKWKHDMFSEANRSPSPKNEEDQIAKVEALLAS